MDDTELVLAETRAALTFCKQMHISLQHVKAANATDTGFVLWSALDMLICHSSLQELCGKKSRRPPWIFRRCKATGSVEL